MTPCNVQCKYQEFYDAQKTNFTCEELVAYCLDYEKWTKTEHLIDTVIDVSLLMSGCGGFFSYILMVVVFRVPDFNGRVTFTTRLLCGWN